MLCPTCGGESPSGGQSDYCLATGVLSDEVRWWSLTDNQGVGHAIYAMESPDYQLGGHRPRRGRGPGLGRVVPFGRAERWGPGVQAGHPAERSG